MLLLEKEKKKIIDDVDTDPMQFELFPMEKLAVRLLFTIQYGEL